MSEIQSTIKAKLELADRFHKEGNYLESIRVCGEVIAEDEICYAAYSRRSHSFYDLGEYRKSFLDIEKLIELRPCSPTAYLRRAEWNLELGDDSAAVKDLNHIICLGEEYFINVARFYRSIAFLNLRQKEKAIEDALKLPRDFRYQVKTHKWGGRVLTRDEIVSILSD